MVLMVGTRLVTPPKVLAYATSIVPDAGLGSYRVCTLTGNTTLDPPSNPADGQQWRIRFIASGADRTVTLASGLRLTTGLTNTLTVLSGKRAMVGMDFESGYAWMVWASSAEL